MNRIFRPIAKNIEQHHYGLRPKSELILEPQTLFFFFKQNVIQMASEYQNMTLRIDKNAPQSFKDPSIQLKDGWILDFCDDMFSKVVLTKVSSNYAIRWPNDSKWSWRLSCPQRFQSENSGTCAILTRSHRLVQVWEEFLDEILMS